MLSLLSKLYLNLMAGLLTLSILAISALSLLNDRRTAWQEAEQASRNLLTALAQDIGSNLVTLDQALRGMAEDVSDKELLDLAPAVRHRVLFDQVRMASYMGSALVLNEDGNAVADAESLLPRLLNVRDRDYFRVHQERPNAGMFLSRPFPSRLRQGELTIAISRRLSHPDGRFAGVVASGIELAKLRALLKNLNLGQEGAVTLFRDDGIVLMRQPYVERQINQDLSGTPNVRRFMRESAGSFEGTAALDGVQRYYTFQHIEGLPLILVVSKGVDEFLAPWRQKALVQGAITLLLCAAVMGLTFLFQRELHRRTGAEAKLARLASTDELTDLANRRSFRDAYERERRKAIRDGSWLSLLFIDADWFKLYNDQYGHGQGDALLSALAGTLAAQLKRPDDLAARYGGEEFTVLLPQTDPVGARLIAEEIRRAVMLLGFEHKRSPFGVATVSVGVASLRSSLGTSATALLEAADSALYQAKEAGRNCVRMHQADLAVVQGVEPRKSH